MLTILPLDNKILYESIMQKHIFKGKEQVVLFAKEMDNELGYIVLDILDNCINILGLKIFNNGSINNDQLEDALIKSCIAYGANRNIFNFESQSYDMFKSLELFGFKAEKDKKVFNAIKQLTTCANC